MKEIDAQKSAVLWLRIIYPLWAAIGMFSLMYVPSTLIDKSNPELTVNNILNNELLFRMGISGSLITQLFSIPVVYFLFKLFYKSFKEATLLIAVFTFLGMPIAMLSTAQLLVVFDVINDPIEVVNALKLNTHGTLIATIFWGLWLLPLGYMVIKSPLFPRVIGWLLILAGVGYSVAAFMYFLDINGLFVDILDYLTFGEVVWMLWVMVMGARWSKLDANPSIF